MAALCGEIVTKAEIKSDGNAFHQLFRDETHRIPTISPGIVQGVELVEGVWGTQGSITCWKYNLDGEVGAVKEVLEEIDDKKKLLRFRVVEGDLLKQYKAFIFITKVDKIDDNTYTVTWTLEYEKLNEAVPPPNSLMNCCIKITKDIENRHLQVQPQL